MGSSGRPAGNGSCTGQNRIINVDNGLVGQSPRCWRLPLLADEDSHSQHTAGVLGALGSGAVSQPGMAKKIDRDINAELQTELSRRTRLRTSSEIKPSHEV